MDKGASVPDRAGGAGAPEPRAASQPEALIPSAGDLIDIGGREVIRFHPTHKRIKDNVPRCIACGQVDEDGFHDARWCAGMGGYLPFPTSKVTIKLRADSGYSSEVKAPLSLEQWRLISIAIGAGPTLPPDIVNAAASAIEARRAATGTGAVHESAAPSGETP